MRAKTEIKVCWIPSKRMLALERGLKKAGKVGSVWDYYDESDLEESETVKTEAEALTVCRRVVHDDDSGEAYLYKVTRPEDDWTEIESAVFNEGDTELVWHK